MALIEIRKISKNFGGLTAINEVDIDVNQGEILGLIGPNGAGKTTLYNVIAGVCKPTGGRVIFKGEDVTGLGTDKIAGKGIVRTFQATNLFKESTVVDNIVIGGHLSNRTSFWGALFNTSFSRREEEKIRVQAVEILDFLGIASLKSEHAKNLPHGYQRLLGVGIALAASPELFLLDEPFTGMNPEETRITMGKIKEIRDSGITIMLVEHDMRAVMSICDRIVVLNFGMKIAEGTPREIRNNEDVIEAYLGKRHAS